MRPSLPRTTDSGVARPCRLRSSSAFAALAASSSGNAAVKDFASPLRDLWVEENEATTHPRSCEGQQATPRRAQWHSRLVAREYVDGRLRVSGSGTWCARQNRAVCEMQWLYQDGTMLAVDKPAGLLSVPGRGEGKRECVAARVQAAVPDALVVHRLDQATSGVMLFGRGGPAQRALSIAFAERRVA